MPAHNIYTIYRAHLTLNPTKGYVGFDKNWPNRKKKHLNAKDNFYFHRALRKYGPDSFVWEILYQDEDKDWTLNVMEEYYIREQKTHVSQGGYNMTWGGEAPMSGRNHSEKTIIKMKKKIPWNKGKTGVYSEDMIRRMKMSMKGKYSWKKGKTGIYFEESLEKMRSIKRGKPSPFKGICRPIKVIEKMRKAALLPYQYWGA